jgi:hypothetical protein
MAASPSTRSTPLPPPSRVTCVYGDSTPFPHEGNFIETIRCSVECGVALLGAHQVIQRAVARAQEIDRARSLERARLHTMNDSVKRALAPEMATHAERMLRAGSRILDATRIAIEGEIAALETLAAGELAKARRSAEEARRVACRAVESFLVLHELPGTESSLRLAATEEGYVAEADAVTPFGIEATFRLQVPDVHPWATPRRVADVSPGTEVHVELESGLFFKKVAVQPVRLDRLYIAGVRVAATRTTLILLRGPASGPGFQLDFDTSGERPRVLLAKLLEDGTDSPDPTLEISGGDAVHLHRLRQRVVDSTAGLTARRQAMTRALFENHALLDHDNPLEIATRIVRCLAPVVREIARRSGAPGELVLRREVSAGRRDEVYITTAELHEKVLTLPALLRATFDPFELAAARSPRAPAPSQHTDVDEGEVEEISRVELIEAVA